MTDDADRFAAKLTQSQRVEILQLLESILAKADIMVKLMGLGSSEMEKAFEGARRQQSVNNDVLFSALRNMQETMTTLVRIFDK